MNQVHELQEDSRREEAASVKLLTTTDCARAIGMSGEFIRGEIRDGRLKARIFTAGRRRAKYRIEESDFIAYRDEHWRKSA
jgi:hypothetical protein